MLKENNNRLSNRHNDNATAKYLSCYYQNVRGLRTKTKEFHLALSEADFDLIALTETWLVDNIPSALLFSNNFSVYRCDRSLSGSSSRGGGVLLAVSNAYESIKLPSRDLSLEYICVRVTCNNAHLYVMVVYIPPQLSSEISTLRSLRDCISGFTLTLKPSDLLFVIGDFNQPSISWSTADPSSSPAYSSITHYEPTARSLAINTFVDGFKFNGLVQLNHINNSHGRMLDLLYANNAAAKLCSPVFPSVVPLVPLDSYHPALDFNIQ
uniref:uncharacterized protein LOC125906927 n=1 Tax=Anopheles coluzzii TaxID=1518534 RepID=UPI0020FF9C83|nr:uncharacterized protein LOC125906927 [Anopheles coluzzii]